MVLAMAMGLSTYNMVSPEDISNNNAMVTSSSSSSSLSTASSSTLSSSCGGWKTNWFSFTSLIGNGGDVMTVSPTGNGYGYMSSPPVWWMGVKEKDGQGPPSVLVKLTPGYPSIAVATAYNAIEGASFPTNVTSPNSPSTLNFYVTVDIEIDDYGTFKQVTLAKCGACSNREESKGEDQWCPGGYNQWWIKSPNCKFNEANDNPLQNSGLTGLAGYDATGPSLTCASTYNGVAGAVSFVITGIHENSPHPGMVYLTRID